MPEEATGEVQQGEVEVPEFKNVREAAAYAREHADLTPVEITEEEAHKPYSDASIDEFGDVVPEPAAATAPVATESAPEAPADPYAEFGTYDQQGNYVPGTATSVRDATTVANALRSEAGLRTVMAQGLQALGYNAEEVAAFLNRQQQAAAAAAPAADPYAGIADDDVVTGADVKALLAAAVTDIKGSFTAAQQAAVAPVQEQIMADRQRNATQAVDSTLTELLGIQNGQPDDVQKGQIQDVQAFAARYLDPNSWDPNAISQAIRQGHADMVARDEARFQQYVAKKRAAAASAPKNIGGGAPAGGEEVKEPKSVREAIAMRKAMGVA